MSQKLSVWNRLSLIVLVPLYIILFPIILLLYLALNIILHILAWLIWNTRGINTLYVYSNSPKWQEYIEQNILPHLPAKVIVLNWSKRKKWKLSLSTLAFRTFGGSQDFNPMGLVFTPFRFVKIFRFHQAFKDFKHGKCESLEKVEAEFFSKIGKNK